MLVCTRHFTVVRTCGRPEQVQSKETSLAMTHKTFGDSELLETKLKEPNFHRTMLYYGLGRDAAQTIGEGTNLLYGG